MRDAAEKKGFICEKSLVGLGEEMMKPASSTFTYTGFHHRHHQQLVLAPGPWVCVCVVAKRNASREMVFFFGLTPLHLHIIRNFTGYMYVCVC